MARRVVAGTLASLAVAFAAACGASDDRRATPATGGTTAAIDLPFPEASFVCDGATTRAGNERARVQADGVHVRIENTSGRTLGWSAEVEGAGGGGSSAPPGVSTHVLDVAPGTLALACYDDRRDDPSEVPRVRVDVVDPEALWVSTVLACERRTVVFADFAPGARGDTGDPVDVVRERLRRDGALRSGDEVDRAGYPAVKQPTRVRLVRKGDIVAVFGLTRGGNGGWLQSSVERCEGAGLG